MSQSAASATCSSTDVARLRIVSSPRGFGCNEAVYGAQNLLDPGPRNFCSQLGQVRDLRFVFEAVHSIALAGFEWKGCGGAHDPARMLLEAQVGGEWKEVSTWDAQPTTDWQFQRIQSHVKSNTWRLTIVRNQGDSSFTVLKAVRFVKDAAPAHGVRPISAKLLSDQSFTDIEILVGDSRFPAHRCMLAAASPVFTAMLCTEMREARTGEIRLEDADEDSVRATLGYIYTGELADDAPLGVASLAHTYEIDGLMDVAFPLALRNVTVENAAATNQMLKVYEGDATLGVYWEEFVRMVQGNTELLKAVMR